jgi:hypothetical protein
MLSRGGGQRRNFGHLNNPFTRMMVRQIVENEGYECPEICSPEELLEAET